MNPRLSTLLAGTTMVLVGLDGAVRGSVVLALAGFGLAAVLALTARRTPAPSSGGSWSPERVAAVLSGAGPGRVQRVAALRAADPGLTLRAASELERRAAR